MMEKYYIFLTKKVVKELKKLPKREKKRILDNLKLLRDFGFTSKLDIKKLKGYKDSYRLRIGKYRILFELEKPNTIIVYSILHRRKAYKR